MARLRCERKCGRTLFKSQIIHGDVFTPAFDAANDNAGQLGLQKIGFFHPNRTDQLFQIFQHKSRASVQYF